MKRIIFMMCISLAFVMALNWLYPAESPEIVIEKEPFADIASPKQYRFYDAEVVMRLYGRTLFRDLTYDVGQLFFMSTRDDALWDSGDIVAIADNKSQLDSNPPIKGGKVALREKRPGIPKVWYEIMTPLIEKDVENGVELLIFDDSKLGNVDEKMWIIMKFCRLLPTDSNGRTDIRVTWGDSESIEEIKQDYEVENAVCYELSASDVTEDSFGFSVKKYTDADNFKEYKGKACMKNGKWQYKTGLWWHTVEN